MKNREINLLARLFYFIFIILIVIVCVLAQQDCGVKTTSSMMNPDLNEHGIVTYINFSGIIVPSIVLSIMFAVKYNFLHIIGNLFAFAMSLSISLAKYISDSINQVIYDVSIAYEYTSIGKAVCIIFWLIFIYSIFLTISCAKKQKKNRELCEKSVS